MTFAYQRRQAKRQLVFFELYSRLHEATDGRCVVSDKPLTFERIDFSHNQPGSPDLLDLLSTPYKFAIEHIILPEAMSEEDSLLLDTLHYIKMRSVVNR